jgi:hypothetical protein
MDIHITVKGDIIDLRGFFKEEKRCYIECLKSYQQKTESTKFLSHFQSQYMDLLMENDELNKAVQDFYTRLAIEQGKQSPPEDLQYFHMNPVQQDEFITANEAARRKKVSITSIRAAIKAGKIVGHREKKGVLLRRDQPGGQWKLPIKSVDRYIVNENKRWK